MKKIGAAWLAASMSCAAVAQTFDNNSVVALYQAGLGDTTIIAKVESIPCGYDVSTEGLVSLKRQGISDEVIATMLRRCSASPRAQGVDASSADLSVARAPGIYLLQDWAVPNHMTALRPSKASGIKVSGNGSILLPYIGKLVLPDLTSGNAVKSKHPTFFFYFNAADKKVSSFGTPNSPAAQSPDEFTLVRFKAKGNEREVGVGRVSVYSVRSGVDPKVSIRFASEEVGESIFKVTIAQDLARGEYGFVITGANNAARVYDFSVE
jgi:hypothetical protein